jgi:hypothetical protein
MSNKDSHLERMIARTETTASNGPAHSAFWLEIQESAYSSQHANLIAHLQNKIGKLAITNAANGYVCLGPEQAAVHVRETAQAVSILLKITYGKNGFPIKQFTSPEVIQNQIESGQLDSWVMIDTESNVPVGTANLKRFSPREWQDAYLKGKPIVLEHARSAALPPGTHTLPSGAVFEYKGKAKVTQLMYQRQLEHLSGQDRGRIDSHPFVFGDARASVERQLTDKSTLKSGAITLHTIRANGLWPFYLHASYAFGSNSANENSEPLLHEPMLGHFQAVDARSQQRYVETVPIYLPNDRELIHFVNSAFTVSGLSPNFVIGNGKSTGRPIALSLSDNSVYLEGELHANQGGQETTSSEIQALLNRSDTPSAILVQVSATENNTAVVERLIQDGFVAVGIIPGTQTNIQNPATGKFVPYTMHHKLVLTNLANGVLHNAPDLDLPRDYQGTSLIGTTQSLWDKLREQYS